MSCSIPAFGGLKRGEGGRAVESVLLRCTGSALVHHVFPRRYLKWPVGDAALGVGCTGEAALKLGDSTQLVAVHALNEFDPKWSGEHKLRQRAGPHLHLPRTIGLGAGMD